MENAGQFNQSLGKSALLIEKVHSCKNCPIRQMAIKQTNSIFAKIHAWHKTWWPGWKVHQARTCFFAANTDSHG
jgi:hypothetical protein